MAETILDANGIDQFINDYTRYGVYILYRRVLPDLRDGLKPVQRRILWSMIHDSKATYSNKIKSAAIVGDVLKKYHPHGDASVYNTIKPMLNWFECNVPLIEKRGNFGTFQGDPPAAPRYTEAGLSEFAIEAILDEVAKYPESVDWVENYDGRFKEPEFLPVKVPLLLINGAFGIGIGMKMEVPSHNINEVIDATLMLMDNPLAEITLVPDHCMPCEIYDTDFTSISENGFGYYTIRGVIDIENYNSEKYKNRTALVIKSIHDMLFLDTIMESIEKLVATKKIIQIENCYDESTPDSLRYVIVLKPGADPYYVRDVIYRNTKMEERLRVNFECVYGLEPMRMSYKTYLLSFIEFRKMTKFRIYSNSLQRIQTKIHEREAYIKALESGEIDNIIEMIRKQKNTNDDYLIEYLVGKLHITDLQAKYILNCDLKKLSIGYLNKYKEEAKQLEADRALTLEKINDANKINQEIKDELIYFKTKYGRKRRCKIIKKKTAVDIPEGIMTIAITGKNFVRKVPEGASFGAVKNDSLKCVININNTDNLLIFDNKGKVFKLPTHKIPFTDKGSGVDIRFLIKGLTADIIGCIPESNIIGLNKHKKKFGNNYLVTINHSGFIKKMDLSEFTAVPSSGFIYAKVDDDDFVNSVSLINETEDVIIYSDRKAISISIANVPTLRRNARGNRAMTTDTGIDGMCIGDAVKANNIIVVTEGGKVNRLFKQNMPQSKTKNGTNIIKLGKNDRIKAIVTGTDNSIVNIIQTSGNITPVSINTIAPGSSISTGVAVITNAKRDPIIEVVSQ